MRRPASSRRSAPTGLLPMGLLAAVLLAAGGVGAGASSPEQVERGQVVYERCAACHALERDRVGPRHCGLFGRRAGSVPGFPYSEAMRASGIVWGRETLDRFLSDPLGTVPGTSMGYAGIPDAEERAQLLAYLEAADRGRACGRRDEKTVDP